ncbi:MAG: hypothetical protein ABEL04_03525 [Salinibacter sp.]|uniref:hypothetical protein n=1 Tax=Salinibacter sp. TaxID=2065818 RepID=UPI0035D50096
MVDALTDPHEVTAAGHTSEDVQGDLADPDFIDRLYETVGGQDAALEMPRNIRINAVSPPWVEKTFEAMREDFEPSLPASAVARPDRKSVAGTRTGAPIDARTVA